MPIVLYHHPASGPSRTVRLVAATIGVELTLKHVDLMAGEHFKPEFIKMNPQHCVPVLDDNGFIISESRAIVIYLAEKYCKNNTVYPKDPNQRALINQRLYFDMGTLYQPFVDYYLLPLYYGATTDLEKFAKIESAFGYLEKFLENQDYVVGQHLTVADIVLATSVSNFLVFNFDYSKYKNVVKWFIKVTAEIPKYKEINEQGLTVYKALVESVKKNNQLNS